jgi:hypothetical protein
LKGQKEIESHSENQQIRGGASFHEKANKKNTKSQSWRTIETKKTGTSVNRNIFF